MKREPGLFKDTAGVSAAIVTIAYLVLIGARHTATLGSVLLVIGVTVLFGALSVLAAIAEYRGTRGDK